MSDSNNELVLVVAARDGQYQLRSSPGIDDMWPDSTDGLFVGEDNWVAVLCGTHWGPVGVTTRQLPSAPEPANTTDTAWEMAAERSLDCPEATITLSELYGDGEPTTLTVMPGWARVRISVRGRTEASQAPELADLNEHHLLEYWPEAARRDPTIIIGPDQYATTHR